MTGGISWPPFDALASIAAACSGLKPDFFIIGIVMTPVARMLETTMPLIDPKSDDASTEIFAAPPRKRPISASEMSLKKLAPPEEDRSCPKKTKGMTTVTPISSTSPNRPLVSSPEIDDHLVQLDLAGLQVPVTRWPTSA